MSIYPTQAGDVTEQGRGLPIAVRDQLKILAIKQRKPMTRLIAEAFNDLFAKCDKPEVAPTDGRDS